MSEKGGGNRYNEGKIRYSLASIHAITELVKVLEFGAKKYDPWNWSKGLSWTDTYDSLERHMKKWMAGEDKDRETGLSHMAHVMCNAMFLVHFIITRTGTDDRPSAQALNNNTEGKIEQSSKESSDNTTTERAQYPVEPGGVPDLQAYVRPYDGILWQNGGVGGDHSTSSGRNGLSA